MLCTLPMLAGPGTDAFNVGVIGGSSMEEKSGTWTGETGAVYEYSNLTNWWGDDVMFYVSKNAFLTVTTPVEGCHVNKITREGGMENTNLNVYVSDTPITAANVASATLAGTLGPVSSITLPAEQPYVALTAAQDGYATSLLFEWVENGGGVTPSDGDHITAANLKAQNPDGNFSATGYQDFEALNATMSYTGESGAVYEFTDLISNGSWWTLGWNWPADPGKMYTKTSGGYIRSIKFDMDWTPSSMAFYVAEGEIDPASPWAALNAKEVRLNKEGDALPEWVADGHYKYFCLTTAEERTNDLTIVWSEEAPVLPCKAPSISCWESRYTPGAEVHVFNQTAGSTMHIEVYLNDVLDTELSKETTEDYTFALPGKAGDVVTVKAYASKEGYTDSDPVSENFVLVQPQVSFINITPEYGLVPGMEMTLSTSTEGAIIAYNYTIYKTRDEAYQPTEPVFESGDLTGEPGQPVTFTIPEENITEGMIFRLDATASCEGYDPSQRRMEQELGSNVLPAPTFDPESGAELQAGKTVTMRKQGNATQMHYTVNGGEEQVTDEWSVTFTVTEPLTIEAWQTGEAPYKDSEKVTATYTVEVLGENVDAIYPSLFTDNTSESSYKVYEPYKSEKTGISYKYDGGMWPNMDTDCFYFAANSDNDLYSIMYNVDNAKDRAIKRIKLESPNSWSAAYILFSADAPATEVTLNSDINNYDYEGSRLRVNTDDSKFKFGEWIDLTSLDPYDYGEGFQDAKYFTIWRFGQQCYISRVLVEYAADTSGIEAIDAENTTEAIYDLNGVKVSNLKNATPGVYIRIVDGKARKVMVK